MLVRLLLSLITDFTSLKPLIWSLTGIIGESEQLYLFFRTIQYLPLVSLVGIIAVFVKAKRPAWQGIIPFYNIKVLGEIAGVNSAVIVTTIAASASNHFLLMRFFKLRYLSVLALIAVFVGWIKICKALQEKFELSGGFTAGLIFLPVLFLPILGFNSMQIVERGGDYDGSKVDSGSFHLSSLSVPRFKKFVPSLLHEQGFEKIIGGKLHTGVGYLFLFQIPVWFRYDETFMFISEKGIYILETSIWKGITECMFIPNSIFAGLRLEKNKLSRKLVITYHDREEMKIDANSGALLKFLGGNIDKIEEINPTLSVTGDYIPDHLSHHIVEPSSKPASNELVLEI